MHVERHIRPAVESAVEAFRVVLIHGPRQSGKTTIAKAVADHLGGTYWSLEDPATLAAIADDPLLHLTRYPAPVVIDEIQLGGDHLVRQIKLQVDKDPSPGRFLLTGSTNFLTVPNLSESLAGRMVICELWPLSMSEISGAAGPQIQRWFDEPFGWYRRTTAWNSAPDRDEYFKMACRGGYPEVIALQDDQHRHQWHASYLHTVADRDIKAISQITLDANLEPLMQWAAATTSQELNVASSAQSLSMARHTLGSYLNWLETVGLVRRLRPWSRNYITRATRRPKLHLTDTGIAASLLGATPSSLSSPTAVYSGPLLESFVVSEVIRQLSAANPTSAARIRCSHFRPHGGDGEVDLVLDRADGAAIAIEVKATSTPQRQHVKQLCWLRDRMDRASPGAFKAGYLLHTGKPCLTIADRIHLRPIATLWQDQPLDQPHSPPALR